MTSAHLTWRVCNPFLGESSLAKFPVSLSNHVGFTLCMIALRQPSPLPRRFGPSEKWWSSRCLTLSDCTITGTSALTSAAVYAVADCCKGVSKVSNIPCPVEIAGSSLGSATTLASKLQTLQARGRSGWVVLAWA